MLWYILRRVNVHMAPISRLELTLYATLHLLSSASEIYELYRQPLPLSNVCASVQPVLQPRIDSDAYMA